VTDAEREERATWKLEQVSFTVRRQLGGVRDGWWIVEAADGTEAASMDNLAALIELADEIYAKHWTRGKITPSA